MEKQSKVVAYDGQYFWEVCYDNTTNSEYEQACVFSDFDKLANGFLWSMSVKGSKQRKYHPKSGMAKSIYALLDSVKDELTKDTGASVLCLTPDVIVEFFYS